MLCVWISDGLQTRSIPFFRMIRDSAMVSNVIGIGYLNSLLRWATIYLSLGESRDSAILQLAGAGIPPGWIDSQPSWRIRNMVNQVAERLKSKTVSILSYRE